MLNKTRKTHQITFFQTPLVYFININHEVFTQCLDWDVVKSNFKGYFSEKEHLLVQVHNKLDQILMMNYKVSDNNTWTVYISNTLSVNMNSRLNTQNDFSRID